MGAGPKNPIVVAVLGFVTCGIYAIIWYYQTIVAVNKYLGKQAVSPILLIVSIICGPVMFYLNYLMGEAMMQAQAKAGLPVEDKKVIYLILALFFPAYAFILQTDLNALWEKAGAPS